MPDSVGFRVPRHKHGWKYLRPTCECANLSAIKNGEVSERFKEHAWKACVGETQPWVRIPPSPPKLLYFHSVNDFVLSVYPRRTLRVAHAWADRVAWPFRLRAPRHLLTGLQTSLFTLLIMRLHSGNPGTPDDIRPQSGHDCGGGRGRSAR